MPVRKDPSGRRFVEAEVEVPGTPEQVWDAIATGSGISSWFVPSEVEGREGGQTVSHFGPGSSMDSVATITAWDPPRRFSATSHDMGPGAPEVATEWIVEARSGSTCTVRVVHSWFASTDDWDDQFEGHEHGWAAFFRILRLYLTHFSGQPSAAFQLMPASADPVPAAWTTLLQKLGIGEAAEGRHVTSAPGAPRLAGRVERAGSEAHPELLIRLETPAPGLAHFFAMPMGGSTYLPVRVYLYGSGSADAVSHEEPRWASWMGALFPAPIHAPAGSQEA